MLERSPRIGSTLDQDWAARQTGGAMVPVRDLLTFLTRNAGVIAGCVAAVLALAFIYLATTRPQYTGVATIFIEAPRIQLLRDDVGANSTRDNATLESHAEILRSDKIILDVISKERLLADPEFAGVSKGWRTRFVELFTGATPPSIPSAIDLIDVVKGRLSVKRIGQSFVIEVSFRSPDRVKSARLANAVTAAYMRELVGSKTNAARVGAEWLEERVTELRKQSTDAARAVQEFRSRTDITDQRRAQLQLSDLESTAETYKTIYAAYLQKLTEIVQQQSVPLVDSRILNEATTPNEPSQPRSKLILALAGLVGLICGIGLGIMRQGFRRSFSSPADLTVLGLDMLGRIPDAEAKASKAQKIGTLYQASSAPDSPFADAFRSIKSLLDLKRVDRPTITLGIVSTAPLEGRSTFALNLAVTLSKSGRRTALVDADAAHAGSITQALFSGAEHGLLDVVAGRTTLSDIVMPIYQGCDLIPVAPLARSGEVSGFFISDKGRLSFRDLASQYDAVIIDLPSPTRMDPRVTLASLDGYILVAQPNNAPLPAIRELTTMLDHVHAGVVGVVVNDGGLRRGRGYKKLLTDLAALLNR